MDRGASAAAAGLHGVVVGDGADHQPGLLRAVFGLQPLLEGLELVLGVVDGRLYRLLEVVVDLAARILQREGGVGAMIHPVAV